MQKSRGNHEIAADDVNLPEEPSIGHFVHNILHASEGMVRMRDIIDEEKYSRYDLNKVPCKSDKAKSIKDIDISGHPGLDQLRADEFIKSYSDFKPVFDFIQHLSFTR
jgi:hypothetical protein